MSILDKAKELFDGRPNVHHDEENGTWWVEAAGEKYTADSLEELEKRLQEVIAERPTTVTDRGFDVVRVDTAMVATTDMSASNLGELGELEAALTNVQLKRAEVTGDEVPGTVTDPRPDPD
jgi:hypothetical protein